MSCRHRAEAQPAVPGTACIPQAEAQHPDPTPPSADPRIPQPMTREIRNLSFSVRRFHTTDAAEIQQILAQSPEAAAWSTKSFEELESSNQSAWVVEQNKTVLGFLVARTLPPDEAEILNLAVIPESRRTGAATKLLQTALTELADKTVRRVHLEVRESNAAAISFYKKNAFLQSGRRPNYYRAPNEAAVLLVRGLTA